MAKVRLARFDDCRCPKFGFPHLVVCREDVELNASHGVALSYTWGEWDRKIFVIGHLLDGREQLLKLKLGSEWNRLDFSCQLVEICQTGQPVWIDQLCIPQ